RERDLPDINTGCYLASAENLTREFMSLSTTSPVFEIPVFGQVLLKYRSLVERPADQCLPILGDDVPAVVKAYLARLRTLARALDGWIDANEDNRVSADGSSLDIL